MTLMWCRIKLSCISWTLVCKNISDWMYFLFIFYLNIYICTELFILFVWDSLATTTTTKRSAEKESHILELKKNYSQLKANYMYVYISFSFFFFKKKICWWIFMCLVVSLAFNSWAISLSHVQVNLWEYIYTYKQ